MKPAKSISEGRRRIESLVKQFDSRLEYYKSTAFEEASTRELFINPFFGALGWDVLDTAGKGPERDVIYHMPIDGTNRWLEGEDQWDEELTAEQLADRNPTLSYPDYAFRVDGQLKFFVEAKKPSVNLVMKAPAFQVKSYAWTEQLPISIVTDFEEFRVFDCTIRPDFDEPNKGSLWDLDMKYDSFLDSWETLWRNLSFEAVSAASLDRLDLAQRRKVPGAVRVDQAFLDELSEWRERIAIDLAHRNIDLESHELAEATQRILDRVIFLRVCEDRRIEPSVVLRRYARINDAYRKVIQEFRRLDVVYNGQLFERHFSEGLELSDSTFQRLVSDLYFPHSPYRFDAIGTDILGAVYERFLGKELMLDEKRSVKLVDKPEVRHAGGVYYTPQWIVSEIVQHTLAPLMKGKTPRAAANIRILDPACGSGSFLLGALEYLIGWHEKYYAANPTEDRRRHFSGPDGKTRLTVDAKAEILSRSIFGVDIDPQAVEVTQMSLYMKVLEDETRHSIQIQQRLFQAPYLPPLNKNIRSGNSLISPSDVPHSLLRDFDLARRLNPFDWESKIDGFGEILSKRGGFDVIIGNPPYTRLQVLRKYRLEETEIYTRKFGSASSGSFDIAVLFVEKVLTLLRSGGRDAATLGMIISRQFTEADYGQPLRSMLASGERVHRVVDFGAGLVFEGVGAYTLLLFASSQRNKTFELVRVPSRPSASELEKAESSRLFRATLPSAELTDDSWHLDLPEESALIGRLERDFPMLRQVARNSIFQGVVTGADFVFCLADHGPSNDGRHRVVSRRDDDDHFLLEPELLRPVLAGRSDIKPFLVSQSSEILLLPYGRDSEDARYTLLEWRALKKNYPLIAKWLADNRSLLEARQGNWSEANWYSFSRRQNLELFEEPKLLIPYMVERLCAYLDERNHFFVNVSTGGYGIPISPVEQPELLVALLNSRLLSWVLKRRSRAWRGGWFAARKGNLVRLPIATATSKQEQVILDLYRRCNEARSQIELEDSDVAKELATRLFAAAVLEFDHAVFDLYRLTDDEKNIVGSDDPNEFESASP